MTLAKKGGDVVDGISINSRARNLLREWYFRTREANFKSCYPAIATRWEKQGLAWQQVGIGFELSRCTSPQEMKDWEEAGHQFCKLPELQQAMIVGLLFHSWTLTDLAAAAELARYVAWGHVRVGLRRYEALCLDVGLIDGGRDVESYLTGAKDIGRYLGVSSKTVHRWIRTSLLPVKRVQGTLMAHRDELDLWFVKVGCNAMKKNLT